MEYSNELKRLGERFPNKNIGSGNPSAKILVVVQKDGNEDVDFKYLKRLFRDFPSPPKSKNLDVLLYCYFPDGNHLQKHDPAKLFGMKWISECTVEDNLQRMFVARAFSQDTMIEKVMFCTYPLDIVSRPIFCSNKLLLNWFLRDAVLLF